MTLFYKHVYGGPGVRVIKDSSRDFPGKTIFISSKMKAISVNMEAVLSKMESISGKIKTILAKMEEIPGKTEAILSKMEGISGKMGLILGDTGVILLAFIGIFIDLYNMFGIIIV